MALNIEVLTGQDSPNSGRIKVNDNFTTVAGEVNTHSSLLGSLSGGVCDLNSAQTLTNKTIGSTNVNPANANIITISYEDIDDNVFGITNTYAGILNADQDTT